MHNAYDVDKSLDELNLIVADACELGIPVGFTSLLPLRDYV